MGPTRTRKIIMSSIETAHPALAKALSARGYDTLTPVQNAVLDVSLETRDLLVSAQTGSGKTVAFGLAMAPTLLGEADTLPQSDAPMAVIIAPTRELALQVSRELEWLFAKANAKLATCVGGMDMRDERRALSRGAHIVVGTPGRLCDHIKRGSLNMNALKAVVLDEADEMLNMGFREELELILGAAPENRRTLMFSATVPKSIIGMTKKYQKDAVRLNTAAEAKQHNDIEYRVLSVSNADKENAIINVLRYYDAKNAIVFGDTRISVNRMTSRFNNRGFSVVALSGELSQKDRTRALQMMRDGRAKVCIATDVAARGLDLPDLELVIHADVPKNPEALLHRSGRTGRAGRKGVSCLIVPPSGRRKVERILTAAKVKAEWASPPSAEAVQEKDNARMIEGLELKGEVTESETRLVEKMMKKFSAEDIATAYLRQYRELYSAPEEIGTVSAYDPSDDSDRKGRKGRDRKERGDRSERAERTPRAGFDDSVWFSLNLGRKQKAEPRWILPMLCKSGGLKKQEIGAIKITDGRTFVEIARDGVSNFETTIGPDGKIEKAITATRIDGQPDFNDGPNSDSTDFVKPAKKPRSSKPRGDKSYGDSSYDDTSPKEPTPPKKADKAPGLSEQDRAAAEAVLKRKPRREDRRPDDFPTEDKSAAAYSQDKAPKAAKTPATPKTMGWAKPNDLDGEPEMFSSKAQAKAAARARGEGKSIEPGSERTGKKPHKKKIAKANARAKALASGETAKPKDPKANSGGRAKASSRPLKGTKKPGSKLNRHKRK